MVKAIVIWFCLFFFSFSPVSAQDYAGEWYSTVLYYYGDSVKLNITKDSVIYQGLYKDRLPADPNSYKITRIKKKDGKSYLFLLIHGSPKIHVIEAFYPDSCIKIYADDIADLTGDYLSVMRGNEFNDVLKKTRAKKLYGAAFSFYTKNVFENFKNLPQFSTLTDTAVREAFINRFFDFRHSIIEKFGRRVVEDHRLTQWLLFDFFAANKLYPFNCLDAAISIRKEKNWRE